MKTRDYKVPLNANLLHLLGCLRRLAGAEEEEDDDFDFGKQQG